MDLKDRINDVRGAIEKAEKNLNKENFESAAIVGSKSLPTNDRSEWDGSKAADRMLKKLVVRRKKM